MRFYDIPKGTEKKKCPRHCGGDVYWIETPRSQPSNAGSGTTRVARGVVRMPIDADIDSGEHPDSFTGGRGCNHFDVCPKDS